MNTTHMHTSRTWESTKTCRSSEGIRCCTLTSAWYTSKCRQWGWVGVFVLLSTPLISPGGRVGGGQAFARKRKKLCERERERRRQSGWRVGSFLRWWEAKHLPPVSPLLPKIRARSHYGLLSTYVSLLLFIYCTVNKKPRRVTSWMNRRYSLAYPCYCKYRTFNSASETTLWTLRPCNSILWHVIWSKCHSRVSRACLQVNLMNSKGDNISVCL